MWQHVKLSEQIRPWDTLACCWDVKQPTNQQTNWAEVYRLLFSSLPPPPPPLLFVCLGLFVVCFFVLFFFFFCFDLYEYHIWVYIMSRVRPAGHLVWQKFSDGHYTQTVQPIFFFFNLPYLQALLTSTILYHIHWPWHWLGVTRSVQSKTFWPNFLTHFSSDQDEIWCSDESIQAEHLENNFEQGLLKRGK